MLTTGEAAEFHNLFQNTRSDILSSLESKSKEPKLNDIASRVVELRKDVERVSDGLAKYDRARYESQLVELEQKISSLRKKARAVNKFSFNKNKVTSAPGTSNTSTSTTASTPIPDANSAVATPSQNDNPTIPIDDETTDSTESSLYTYTISAKSYSYIQSPIFNKSTAITLSSSSSVGKSTSATTATDQTYTLSLENLENCIINLHPQTKTTTTTSESKADLLSESTSTLTAIHVNQLKRCIILCPVIKGSAMFSNCSNSIVMIGAQQFRMHSSVHTNILLNVPSLPIIEHCSSLQFGEYPPDLLNPNEQRIESNHSLVQDFDWVRGGQSPNWSILRPSEAIELGKRILSELRRRSEQCSHYSDTVQVDEILDRLLPMS